MIYWNLYSLAQLSLPSVKTWVLCVFRKAIVNEHINMYSLEMQQTPGEGRRGLNCVCYIALVAFHFVALALHSFVRPGQNELQSGVSLAPNRVVQGLYLDKSAILFFPALLTPVIR